MVVASVKRRRGERRDASSRARSGRSGRRSGILQSIALTLVLFIGVGILLYPSVASYVNSRIFADQVEAYTKTVSSMDTTKRKNMLAEARAYNENLAGDPVHDPFVKGSGYALPTNYNDVLNVDGNGLMGTIEIPSIDVKLPIHHGTSDEVLSEGTGHIAQTSLPIGGKGTHAVITGHTGIPNKTLFTNLIRMKKGDIFIINVLGEQHAYKVDQIRVIEPENLSEIQVEKDKEYVTLLTCTPYGINSHRLLVRGVPTVLPKDSSALRHPMPWWLLLVLVIAFVLSSGTFMVAGTQRQSAQLALRRLAAERSAGEGDPPAPDGPDGPDAPDGPDGPDEPSLLDEEDSSTSLGMTKPVVGSYPSPVVPSTPSPVIPSEGAAVVEESPRVSAAPTTASPTASPLEVPSHLLSVPSLRNGSLPQSGEGERP